MLIPSFTKRDIAAEVAGDRHPTMDYHALKAALGSGAEIADYATVEADRHPLVRLARKAGRDVALAMHGFLRGRDFDVIFSNGENVSIPLAALTSFARRRCGHVLIGHHLSTPKKAPFFKKLRGQMDAIFVYAETQRRYGIEKLGIPAERLRLIPFHADDRFYRPAAPTLAAGPMICSAGLEWRDYPTLIEAVRGLDVEVRLAAASPWSKHQDETADRELPHNVSARRYSYAELRDLYAEARFVVVPLYENDFQAGVTTMLEAMAMGKAVIVSRTEGQYDVVQDGVNGLYVPPGNPAALRAAIGRLLECPELASFLGANARRTIEERMSLDRWASSIAEVICETAGSSV